MLIYTRQVTIHPIEMKVVVFFAAICFLALAMAQEEDTDWPPAPKPRRNICGCLFALSYEKFYNKVFYRIENKNTSVMPATNSET